MGDFLKKPLGRSLNDLAQQRARDALQSSGRSLPCSVTAVVSSGIVTVKFEVNAAPFTLPSITVPVMMSRYVRIPVQVGDMGVVLAADARLGGVTGLGSGVANLSEPANLGALMFCPLGSTAWSEVDLDTTVIFDPSEAHRIEVSGDGVSIDSGAIKTDGATKLGHYGIAPVTRQSVTGALTSITDANAKAVILSLINALNANGIILKATT